MSPHSGPTYPAAKGAYENMDYICISFATDADKAAALIPKALQFLKLAGADVLQIVGMPWHITKADFYVGEAAGMEMYPWLEDPIGTLPPCNGVLGSFIIRGDMYTKSEEWAVLEDLKKNNAK